MLLSLRAHFGIPAHEFLEYTYWQAVGYLKAIPYVLGAPAEKTEPKKKSMTFEDMIAAGALGKV